MQLVETSFLFLLLLNFIGAVTILNIDNHIDEDESFHDLSGVHLRVAIANVRQNLDRTIISSDFEIQFIRSFIIVSSFSGDYKKLNRSHNWLFWGHLPSFSVDRSETEFYVNNEKIQIKESQT